VVTSKSLLKKQSNSVKEKPKMLGFLQPPASRGTQRSCRRSRKRQMKRRRKPSGFVVSTMPAFPLIVLTGPSTMAFSLP
jgi:hypothetical protein